MIDIATTVVVLACVFSAATGKAAARRHRFWPAWCICGALSGPFALLYVLLAPRLESCPSCGKYIRIAPGRSCRRCAWTPPLKNAPAASDIGEALGFRLGDTAAQIERSLTASNVPFERVSESMLRCAEREAFGHPASVTIELDEGRANCIRVSYPADRDYRIYYDLRAALVSKYGKPDDENFDGGYTGNWSAKKMRVSLSTTPPASKEATPSTTVIYRIPDGNPEKTKKTV